MNRPIKFRAWDKKEKKMFPNNMKEEITRCGFCGRFVRGLEYVPDEELDKIDKEILAKTPLGYCPNANGEAQEE